MARKFKLKLRICCKHSDGIYYALPDSKSIRKLQTLFVRKNPGKGSMDAIIAHVPVAAESGRIPVPVDYNEGVWL